MTLVKSAPLALGQVSSDLDWRRKQLASVSRQIGVRCILRIEKAFGELDHAKVGECCEVLATPARGDRE